MVEEGLEYRNETLGDKNAELIGYLMGQGMSYQQTKDWLDKHCKGWRSRPPKGARRIADQSSKDLD